MAARSPKHQELREREARWRAIVEAAVDSIVTIDQRGRVEWCNAATEKVFGYRPDELIGQNISVLMPEPQSAEHNEYLKRYLRTGERHIIGIGREVTGRRKDSSLFPLDLTVTELHLDGRRVFAGIMRDISDKKLAEQRAMQSERLAAIGQMVTGLAHESRNALQRIQACLEMLELEIDGNSTAQDLIERIRRAQDDLRRLFEEVRDFAKPLQVEHAPCLIQDAWREAWALLSAQRKGRTTRLIESLPTDTIACLGDHFRLVQVFRNLFENALAAATDPVEIHVTCRETAFDRRPFWEVRVRDNGPGLTAEQQARIFEPFFTTKSKGTGLGMPIARRILEAHLGTLDAGNYSGGAEFLLRLPKSLTP